MNEALRNAIQERIELGHSKEEIVSELEAAGYPAEDALAAYDAVAGVEETEAVAPIPVPQEPDEMVQLQRSEPPVSSATAGSPSSPPRLSTKTPVAGSRWPVYIAIAFAAVVLIGGVAYGAVSGGFSKLISTLFSGGVPYTTEAALIEGLIDSSQKLTAYGVNLSYHLAIEERQPDTKTLNRSALPAEGREEFDDNVSMMIQYGVLPAEADIRFALSGLIDGRDTQNPEFDLSMSFNMLAEPFIMNTAGSLRLADGAMYGKIDDVPANMRMYLPDIPTDVWIKLGEMDGLDLPVSPMLPIETQQTLNRLSPELVRVLAAELKRLAALPLAARDSYDYLSAQVAQLGATPLLDTDMSAEELALLRRSKELLVEYPIISFVKEPMKVDWQGETVYQYDLDIDINNLKTYLFKIISEGEAITGEVLPIAESELREMFEVAEPLLVEFNRLTDIRYYIRPDATTAGFYFGSVFTLDHSEMKQQYRVEIEGGMTRQNDALDITAPADLYDQSLEEIMESSISEARAAGADASVKQTLSMLRSYAELSYNDNNYTYNMVCEDERIQSSLISVLDYYTEFPQPRRDARSGPGMIVCNDQDESYAITAPLASDMSIVWCIDSTGFIGEVPPSALSSGDDTSCQ